MSDYAKLSQAHDYVCRTLDKLDDVIENYKVTKKFEAGPKGGRRLLDVTYDFYPTYSFAAEQTRINKHNIGLKLKSEAGQADLFRE